MIHLLTAIGLTPGGSSTVHIYPQTIHKTIQQEQYIILSELKIKPVVKNNKVIELNGTTCLENGQRQTDRLPHFIMEFQPCGKRSGRRPSKDFSTVNGTGTGHVA